MQHAATALMLMTALLLAGCAGFAPGMEDTHAEHSEVGHRAPDAHHDGHAVGDHHDRSGMERPAFAPAEGKIPTAEDAADFEQKSSLRIVGDDGFRPAAGVRSGNGTLEDPYIIEHWYVAGDLYIQDTDACFVVRENYIGGQLTLNWNGICAHVHHNHVYDLRVNENIRRDGYATGGYIEHNLIEFVGQLRHYDGEFRYNEVGPMPSRGPWDDVLETTPLLAPQFLIANIDGFNQGRIHHNTFHGSVDLDFHGHHHGTGFFAPHSHYHGDNESRKMPHDHTARWTSVEFSDNLIIDEEGYGLRYEDRNHAGDDRVAASEQEETLDEDHFHRTRIDIVRNTVQGAGIWVDVFNSQDKRHTERNDGWLFVQDNVVELVGRDPGPLGVYGIESHTAIRLATMKEGEFVVSGNRLSFTQGEQSGIQILTPEVYPTAIAVQGLRDAHLQIHDNTGTGFHTGILARAFEEVVWRLENNDLRAKVPMDADDSVPMPE